jgi:hypothetical protein
MVLALFRMPYNLLTSIFLNTYIISIDGSCISCTTCIVYQYVKELSNFFVLKAGAKIRALF